MDLRTQVIASLAHRLVKLRGTQESFTVELEGVFVQAASYDGDAVLVEITGDRFLAVGRSLTIDQHDELLRLNFMRPTDDMPNWWIGIEDGHDRALFATARSAPTINCSRPIMLVSSLATRRTLGKPFRRRSDSRRGVKTSTSRSS